MRAATFQWGEGTLTRGSLCTAATFLALGGTQRLFGDPDPRLSGDPSKRNCLSGIGGFYTLS